MQSLHGVPQLRFHAQVKPYLSKASRCASQPPWLVKAIADGVDLSLDRVLLQAGRHFRDAFDLSIISDGTKRQRAAMDLAWMVISMLRPDVQSGTLVVRPHEDSDMRRWAAEILGIGAGLEMLRVAGAIDARTLRKNKGKSPTFDFRARTKTNLRTAQIELKGTIDDGSRAKHQKSIREKMSKLSTSLTSPVTFHDGIGVIFFGWTPSSRRFADFQVADPEGNQESDEGETDRDLLRFYADIYELAGLIDGANALRDAANAVNAPSELSAEERRAYFGSVGATTGRFARMTQNFQLDGTTLRYGGTSFEASKYPLDLGALTAAPDMSEFPFLFVGVHEAVIGLMRSGDFGTLRATTFPESSYRFERAVPDSTRALQGTLTPTFKGFVSLMSDGTAYLWSNFIPDDNLELSDV